jgi:hypothetical protein
MTTVVVSGAVANKHRQGGSIWVRMSWAEALCDAGFEVLFVEQIEEAACVDEAGASVSFEASANLATFDRTMEDFGLTGSAALVCTDGPRVHGMAAGDLLARAAEADLLVNLGGHLRWAPLLRCADRRAFVDLDPGFTQIWHQEGRDLGVEDHHVHFTVGMNVGTPRCPVPTNGTEWRSIRQPVMLERWPQVDATPLKSFSTVASWRGAYGPVTWAGQTYGVKAHEFRRFLSLPREVEARFDLALDIHPGDAADIRRLEEHGWQLRDPAAAAADPNDFRRFVQESGAEFSPAQGIYVHTCSGWFSDRTVRYLASGLPALVQDTGFSQYLPTGDGLLSFRTLADACAGARSLLTDYDHHRRAAREIAEEYFAPERALCPLLEDMAVAP